MKSESEAAVGDMAASSDAGQSKNKRNAGKSGVGSVEKTKIPAISPTMAKTTPV